LLSSRLPAGVLSPTKIYHPKTISQHTASQQLLQPPCSKPEIKSTDKSQINAGEDTKSKFRRYTSGLFKRKDGSQAGRPGAALSGQQSIGQYLKKPNLQNQNQRESCHAKSNLLGQQNPTSSGINCPPATLSVKPRHPEFIIDITASKFIEPSHHQVNAPLSEDETPKVSLELDKNFPVSSSNAEENEGACFQVADDNLELDGQKASDPCISFSRHEASSRPFLFGSQNNLLCLSKRQELGGTGRPLSAITSLSGPSSGIQVKD
jgi:hypothetical protein